MAEKQAGECEFRMTELESPNDRVGRCAKKRSSRALDLALLTGLAFAITAGPVLLHQVSQPLAIAFCLTSSCFIALYLERAVPIVLLVSLLFQTMFVAMTFALCRAIFRSRCAQGL